MKILCVCLIGMILDWIFGDPVWLYHPVRIIGKWIAFLEKIFRKLAGDQEGNEKKLLIAGGIFYIWQRSSAHVQHLCWSVSGVISCWQQDLSEKKVKKYIRN